MHNETSFLELIHQDTYCVFWLFYLGYVFITGYSGLLKINSALGWMEIAGAVCLIIGLFYPPLTLIPLIWLFPLAIITLFRRTPQQFYNTLYRCVIPILLALMNRSYGII